MPKFSPLDGHDKRRVEHRPPSPRRLRCSESPHLSPREMEVLKLLIHGYTLVEIARQLGISKWTVLRHLEAARMRKQARTNCELVSMFWAYQIRTCTCGTTLSIVLPKPEIVPEGAD